MIVPYFNVLVLPQTRNQILLQSQSKHLLIDYFQQYFQSHEQSRRLQIRIQESESESKTLKAQAKRIIEEIFQDSNLRIFKVNGSYTKNREILTMYQGLKEISITQGATSKKPATLNNLQKLKQYFEQFKTEGQMKEFLKNLLIEDISHEKRIIKYRRKKEIENIIQVVLLNLEGEIKICTAGENQENGIENIDIVIVNQEIILNSSLESIVTHLRTHYRIDESINPQITFEITTKALVQNAKCLLRQLFSSYWEDSNIQTKQIYSFASDLTLLSNLKVVLGYGFRLVAEEEALKQSFLEFVRQMKSKYTNELSTYFKGFASHLQYRRFKEEYTIKRKCVHSINSHFLSFSISISYRHELSTWRHQQCSMIQTRIRTFLLQRKKQKQRYEAYLEQKRQQKAMMKDYYTRLQNHYNKIELQKLKQYNKYKYGFSCCTHFIEITNHSNYGLFDPNNILTLIEKANRSQELITKILCSRHCIQFTNIEGKNYRLGEYGETDTKQLATQYSTKQNNQKLSNTMTNSKISLASSRSSASKELRDKTSKESRNRSYQSLTVQKTRNKNKIIKNEEDNFQFMIDEHGWLYGKGSNDEGQLGLGSRQAFENFTLIFRQYKIKTLSSVNKHTVVITNVNKIFYFGIQKGILPRSMIPQEIPLSIGVIKDVVCSIDNTYFLTDENKIYSFNSQSFIRIPKEISLGFDDFGIIRTGTNNIEIVYFIGFWCNSLDKTQKAEIAKYLTKPQLKEGFDAAQSMLVDSFDLDSNRKDKKMDFNELSAILEESYF